MEIISISIDRKALENLNKTQEELGFRSRSKLLRAAIDSLINEYSALDARSGHCDAVFTVTFDQHVGDRFGKIMKEYDRVIRTEIHQHHAETCLRVIIACGDSRKVRDLFAALKNEKRINSVNYSVL